MKYRVLIAGAAGRMGRHVVSAVASAEDMEPVGGVDRSGAGRDLGEAAGLGDLGIRIDNDLETALDRLRPDVVVDFTVPGVVLDHIYAAIRAGIPAVIGTTGLSEGEMADVDAAAWEAGVGVIIAPNFAIGAVLMMRFAAEASRFLPNVEIIELHHENKRDAPSGTAIRTAEMVRRARNDGMRTELIQAGEGQARGSDAGGVRIHSVRLPGLVAHQEVLLGLAGQILSIRHDSVDRESFMPGVLLAIREVGNLPGVTYGLDRLLFPDDPMVR